MRLLAIFLGLFVLIVFLAGYFYISSMAPGTHGSIKAYEYPVKKSELEKAVDTVLKYGKTVRRDTVDNYYTYVDSNKVETKIHDNYYNDGKRYLCINIALEKDTFEYTIQYAGTEQDWDTSKHSYVSIAYAWDKKGNGGSEGNGGFNFKWGFKKKITRIFKTEFIDKVDRQLGKPHIDVD